MPVVWRITSSMEFMPKSSIAGQGTVAMEILRQHPTPLDAIFVPVGGGGLIAGIAAYVKYLRPDIKVIGVEPDDSNCLQAAMAAGERVVLPSVGIFADGVAVGQIGQHTFDICKDYVDEVITVSTDEICAAIKDIFDDTRSITEPAGALGVAGIKKYVEQRGVRGQTLVAIDSGANVNFDRLRHVDLLNTQSLVQMGTLTPAIALMLKAGLAVEKLVLVPVW